MEKLSIRQRISKYYSLSISAFHRLRGCDIGNNCKISKSAIIDRAYPKGIHIGNNVRVLIEAMILSHDYVRSLLEGQKMFCDTFIGDNCVIGGRAMIMPGVRLGNHVYVAAGSIVTKSFPDHCMIAGNPAKIIRTGTVINEKGQILLKGERVIEN